MNRIDEKSKIIDRIKKRWRKAVLSVTLTAAMVACNIGGQVSTVMAGDYSDMAVIELEGANLYDSIQAAIEGDAELSTDDIRFTNGKIEQYMKLFYGRETKERDRLALNGTENAASRILEFYPDYEGNMEIEFRAFVRLPLDAGDDYVLTGEEEVIFLYINNSDDTVKCIVSVDGRKRGRTVTIKGYEDAFGEEEVNLISVGPNAQETDAATGEITDQESAGQEPVEQESSESQEPSDSQETPAGQETPETPESQEPSDDQETPDRQESQDETEEKEVIEEKDEIRQEADFDREVKSEEKEEKDQPETEEITASISIHRVPLVAAEEDGGSGDQEDASEKSERKAEEEPRETQDSGDDKSQKKTEDAGEENADKTTRAAETQESDFIEATERETTSQSSEIEEVTDPVESGETEDSGETEENTDSVEDTDPTESVETQESVENVETTDAVESTAAVEIEGKDTEPLREGMYQLVGIDGCSTAKAYVTNINHLGIDLEAATGFFFQQEMEDGVTITLKADNKASKELTEEVTADVTDVSDDVKNAIARNTGAEVEDVIAYDVNLFDANGLLIENETWEGSVSISFSGERIEEISQRTSLLSVIHDQSETPGNQEGLEPEQLDLQILSSVDTRDTAVEKVEGEVNSFSIVGAAGLKSNLDGGILVKELVENNKIEVSTENFGGDGDVITVNDDIAFCISPASKYPDEKIFVENYKQYGYKSFVGYKVDPATGSPKVYSDKGLYLASLVAEMGYPNDTYGFCEKYCPGNKNAQYEQTLLAIYKCVYETKMPERDSEGDIPEAWKGSSLLYALVEKATEISENQDKLRLSYPDSELVFHEEDEGVWVTEAFRLRSSQPVYELQNLSKGISIQIKAAGDTWTGIEPTKIPADSILRLISAGKPQSGTFTAYISGEGIELDTEKCFLYTAGEYEIDKKSYQNLLVVKNKPIKEEETCDIKYSVKDTSDVPDTPDVPDTLVPPVQPTVPDTPSGGSDGSSGGNSGGGDSTGGRYTPDTGGPGTAEPAVVNLADVDVPLASLPVMPTGEVTILDDDVPLASLPKTGDRRGAKNIAFSVSGVLLAAYCLLKRRKSNENHILG